MLLQPPLKWNVDSQDFTVRGESPVKERIAHRLTYP